MLVLSRHRDESIMIGDQIKVTVADIRGDKVRIGIIAPSEIPVHREEVYEQFKRGDSPRVQILSSTKDKFAALLKCLDTLIRKDLIHRLDTLNYDLAAIRGSAPCIKDLESLCNQARKMETNEVRTKARSIGEQFAQVV